MTAAFTKGPWHYRPHQFDDWGFVRATPDEESEIGGIICQARDPDVWEDDQLNEHRLNKTDPWEANARLIAAAPDMDAMLGEVIDVLEGMNDDEISEELLPRIRSVRAKARGEA